MTLVRWSEKDRIEGAQIVEDADAFDACLQAGEAAAIWRRQTPRDIQSWLNGLDPQHLPQGRVTLPATAVADVVTQLCDKSGLPAGQERDWLQNDIVALADMFSDLMSVKYLRLRLDVVITDACRKFHIDATTARLVCTYRGTGTQYGVSMDGRAPKRVFTVQTGSPILLRGSLWPGAFSAGVLHRSPPIEGSGETRLVLVLDPVFDREDTA
ncbi:DUF1826 domain-containing protein [Phaeobacter porticola]|uniref:DUF1826 domain-containing protein n=1 Tax=Phaeobacter porticola TaxID=1844006 RepID=A0A1L3I1V4_9RHOB|nr:DUF1826 domain-containing protein [Phaeobacter porticola]APG46089.1 hypothetical protein PhaeoP97_00651 [Phaeobacter porticola]